MPQLDPTTQAVQDYVKAIYALEEGGDVPVPTSSLADRLEVTPGSVSAMVKRLDERGLVSHVPYRGVGLTPSGRRVALEVLRHHRLLETFLARELGMPWDRVHAQAEVLEHVLSEELEAVIAAKLGHPDRDPHGDPIPSAELEIDESPSDSLDGLQIGERGIVVRVQDADPQMLGYLADRGIGPGARFEVIDRQPFGGPLFVRFGDQVHTIGGALTTAIRVNREGGVP